MKAIEVSRHGGPDVLQVVERPRPDPGPGQVLIKVKAAGINFSDLMRRAGTYPMSAPPPFVPGLEAAGVVAAVGPDVTAPAVGSRVVAALWDGGGYAEYALADAAQVVPLPDSLDFAPATALLAQGLTAYFLLRRGAALQPGQSVLVSAAAGGVGSLAVQIAKLMGAGTVVGTASTDAKRALVKELGADEAVDYTQEHWAEAVKSATGGRGADIFLDATGDTQAGLPALAPGGTWVLYGAQQGAIDALSGGALQSMIFREQTVRGYTLNGDFSHPETIGAALGEMFGWVAAGRLRLEVGNRFPLAEARQAHEAMEARRTTGKVVLTAD